MTTYWNFPATIGGNINSINHAGLETFRGNALESLTREICQNSLDAVRDKTKPVIVEFKGFTTHTNNFPNHKELLNVFRDCRVTWQGRNKQSEDFIEDAVQILQKDKMQFLRISDFNTKGLEGAKDAELGSAWSSLVKEAGSSNKDESSGGSFGIGKSAPFLNSKLRTIFYSSFDTTGYESHIGVANILSYQKPDNRVTTGTGFYTNSEYSTAIYGQLPLDPSFTRTETGTDIYITAFEPVQDWQEEIKKSVLLNFFMTVFQHKLIVRINDLEINSDNIAELIEALDDTEDNRVLKNYFSLLTSPQTIQISYPAQKYKDITFKEGEAVLYLLNGEDLNRRVLMTRKTGMRIYEQNRISGSISFTGLLTITGTNMNNIFKQMENPAHNEWSPERFEKDPRLAKKIFADLRKFMREAVRNQFQEKIDDEMDAVGLSDFLPNKNLISEGEINKRESLQTKIKTLIRKEKVEEPKQPKRRNTRQLDTDMEEIEKQLAGEFGITPTGDKGGHGTGTHEGGGNQGGGLTEPDGVNELDRNKQGDLDMREKRKPSKHPIPIKQRYVCVNKEIGAYRIFIQPEKTVASARLAFRVMGEQSDYDLPIKSADTNDSRVTVDKVNANNVYVHSVRKNKPFVLNVCINYSDYCVMGVTLYEN
ncbi:hypothetical protein ACFFIS_06820 [Virgibacillus soli]|uniref:hypothetical protein n=1 Tax=Paracerasibacillus soli TaxID=480284 RepID=UPI0035E677F7